MDEKTKIVIRDAKGIKVFECELSPLVYGLVKEHNKTSEEVHQWSIELLKCEKQ